MRFANYGLACNVPTDITKEQFSGTFGDNTPYGAATAAIADTVFAKTNRWYNLVYTYDGNISKTYINGVMDEIRIYDRPLCGGEVKLLTKLKD